MPKVKLEINVPLEGALKYARGKHYDSTIPGKLGSMMYSLQSGEVIFLDEDICDEPDEMFRAAHVGAGDMFRLVLRKGKNGGGKYYELHKLSDAAEPALDSRRYPDANGEFNALPTSVPPTKLESQLKASIDHVNAQRATPSHEQPAAPSAAPVQKAQPIQHNAQGQTVASNLVAAALIAAIDGFLIARDYATSKGLPFELELNFNGEDVRTVANMIAINASKSPAYAPPQTINGGARTWPQ